MVGIGDLQAPLQNGELEYLQEQKSDAQAPVAEAENVININCLLMIAFELVRKRFGNWEQSRPRCHHTKTASTAIDCE